MRVHLIQSRAHFSNHTKIRELHFAIRVDQHIRGLNVAVRLFVRATYERENTILPMQNVEFLVDVGQALQKLQGNLPQLLFWNPPRTRQQSYNNDDIGHIWIS